MIRTASLTALLCLTACSASEPRDDSAATTAEPAATATLEAGEADAAQAKAWIKEHYGDMGKLMVRQGAADLDGDGEEEQFVFLGGPMVCGSGGCPLVVLKKNGGRFEKILETSVTQLPVGVLDTSTNGMRDLWVTVYGGGAPQTTRKLSWDGSAYPTNPTLDEVETTDAPGTVVIGAGELEALD